MVHLSEELIPSFKDNELCERGRLRVSYEWLKRGRFQRRCVFKCCGVVQRCGVHNRQRRGINR